MRRKEKRRGEKGRKGEGKKGSKRRGRGRILIQSKRKEMNQEREEKVG